VLSLDRSPGVGRLRVLQTPQVPVACLLEMALISAQQTLPSFSAGTWTLTNIQLPNALTLDVERDVVTCLHPDVDEQSFVFEITSVQGREATLHASGRIHVKQDHQLEGGVLDRLITPITISAGKLYEKLEAAGLKYDVPWQSIDTVHANPLENVYRCELRESLFGRLGTLETCIQLAIMSSATHDLQLAYWEGRVYRLLGQLRFVCSISCINAPKQSCCGNGRPLGYKWPVSYLSQGCALEQSGSEKYRNGGVSRSPVNF
jgi:hypothetical protein